jgi:O-antigen/teichoic acid export membrane protein
MSVPAKLASSFSAQAAVAMLGIASVPVYLALMGPEGYGLVAFHVTLQTWMMLLDMGLPTAMARRLSVWQASGESGQVASFIKAVERVFWLGAGLATLAVAAASPWIGTSWLGRSALDMADLIWSLRLMGCLIALRWVASLYQAALIGLERQNLVNGVIVGSALGRTVAAVAGLLLVSRDPQTYFIVHLIGALAEVLVLRKTLMRAISWRDAVPSDLRTLSEDLKLAGGFALVTVVWLAVNQIDKIVLSHMLPLKDFGLFSIVSAICTGVATLVPAFTQAIQPRLTTLLAQQRRGEFIQLYRLSAALLLALSASLAGTVAAFPTLTLYAWTGSSEQGWNLASVLTVYAAGTGLANMLLAPFLLQYASGDIRIHVKSYAILGTVWIPAALWSTYNHGPWGAGLAWLIGNLALLSVCWPLVHGRLLSRPESKGMYASIFSQLLLISGVIAALYVLVPMITGRVGALAALMCIAAATLSVGILASSDLRLYCFQWYARPRLGA